MASPLGFLLPAALTLCVSCVKTGEQDTDAALLKPAYEAVVKRDLPEPIRRIIDDCERKFSSSVVKKEEREEYVKMCRELSAQLGEDALPLLRMWLHWQFTNPETQCTEGEYLLYRAWAALLDRVPLAKLEEMVAEDADSYCVERLMHTVTRRGKDEALPVLKRVFEKGGVRVKSAVIAQFGGIWRTPLREDTATATDLTRQFMEYLGQDAVTRLLSQETPIADRHDVVRLVAESVYRLGPEYRPQLRRLLRELPLDQWLCIDHGIDTAPIFAERTIIDLNKAAFGKEIIPDLVRLFGHEESWVRYKAFEAFIVLRGTGYEAQVVPLLDDEWYTPQIEAAIYLAGKGVADDKVAAVLREAVRFDALGLFELDWHDYGGYPYPDFSRAARAFCDVRPKEATTAMLSILKWNLGRDAVWSAAFPLYLEFSGRKSPPRPLLHDSVLLNYWEVLRELLKDVDESKLPSPVCPAGIRVIRPAPRYGHVPRVKRDVDAVIGKLREAYRKVKPRTDYGYVESDYSPYCRTVYRLFENDRGFITNVYDVLDRLYVDLEKGDQAAGRILGHVLETIVGSRFLGGDPPPRKIVYCWFKPDGDMEKRAKVIEDAFHNYEDDRPQPDMEDVLEAVVLLEEGRNSGTFGSPGFWYGDATFAVQNYIPGRHLDAEVPWGGESMPLLKRKLLWQAAVNPRLFLKMLESLRPRRTDHRRWLRNYVFSFNRLGIKRRPAPEHEGESDDHALNALDPLLHPHSDVYLGDYEVTDGEAIRTAGHPAEGLIDGFNFRYEQPEYECCVPSIRQRYQYWIVVADGMEPGWRKEDEWDLYVFPKYDEDRLDRELDEIEALVKQYYRLPADAE